MSDEDAGREWVFDPEVIEGDPGAGVVPPHPDGRDYPSPEGPGLSADDRTVEERMAAEKEFERQEREAEAEKYIPPEDHLHEPHGDEHDDIEIP